MQEEQRPRVMAVSERWIPEWIQSCTRLIHDLLQVFETDALHFEFHFLPTADPDLIIATETGILKVILEDAIRHGWVTISRPRQLSLKNLPDPKRKTYAVIVTSAERHDHWRSELEAAKESDTAIHTSLAEIESFASGDSDAVRSFCRAKST